MILIVLVAGGWWFTHTFWSISGPQNAANTFFRTNANAGPAEAYATTAPAFQEVTPEPYWLSTSQRLRLGTYYAADWTDYQTIGETATVRGVVKRLSLPDLKASVDLRKINGTWKVATISMENDASSGDQSAQLQSNQVPSQMQPAIAPQQPQPQPLPDANPQATPSEQAPGPVMSVPRFGGAPDQSANSTPTNLPLGRAGPPGTALPSGQVGPGCMSQLWKGGFHADQVNCPLYLATRPGQTEECFAHATDGRTSPLTVTFLDYDPVTRQGTFDCRLHP